MRDIRDLARAVFENSGYEVTMNETPSQTGCGDMLCRPTQEPEKSTRVLTVSNLNQMPSKQQIETIIAESLANGQSQVQVISVTAFPQTFIELSQQGAGLSLVNQDSFKKGVAALPAEVREKFEKPAPLPEPVQQAPAKPATPASAPKSLSKSVHRGKLYIIGGITAALVIVAVAVAILLSSNGGKEPEVTDFTPERSQVEAVSLKPEAEKARPKRGR